MRPTNTKKRAHYLVFNEIKPTLRLAGCYHFTRDIWFQYRIPSHHLMLIESGRIAAQTKDGAFEAKSGDLLCFRPAEVNQYGTRTPTLFYQAHVEFAGPPRHRLTPYFEGSGPLPVRISLGDSFDEMRKLFETLCLEVTHAGIIHRLRIRSVIFEILALIATEAGHVQEDAAHMDPWMRVQQRLDSTLHKGLKIEDLARQMGLGAEHFIRQFKDQFGMSPKAYHTRARLQEAARSLRGSRKSIKAIAYELGFNDPKSFTRRFKHCLGVTPSDLRLAPTSGTAEAAEIRKQGFPMNVHLLPPDPGQRDFQCYLPRKTRGPASRAEQNKLLDKLCHPEKYV
jgi:AraC-like DNA-binding protein